MLSPVVKKSLATAAVGTAAFATLPNQKVYAAEETKKSKLSIYDEPQAEVVIVEEPTKLEEHVAYAEKYANERVEEGKTHVNKLHGEWKQFEQCVKNTVKETIAKDEEILPNALYIGVAALAGTILARNRNIVIRFATSTALAVGASHYLLPKTTQNVCVQLEKVERKYPQLQSAHQSVNEVVGDARKQFDGAVAEVRSTVDDSILCHFQQKDASQQALDKFESVKKSVESMYSTRSNPGVEETLKKNN
ncbi:apolipo protein O-domain-containing protein [Zychaea mexicana]|uniref:apolipo protein O-domain-containing protein n=1 Tax=Zychaea mexicana TaxID=64656 RepID=UPI0022FEA4BC|nr:apolipo protein O-domain-containing protein [Zychaea mexicana]KAI9498845.1 apolipo protein O-domain-containing protein [Zychaea mexicana]